MIIRNFNSIFEKQDYKKIYDISIGTNYGDSYFPHESFPLENMIGVFEEEELISALHIIEYHSIKIRNRYFKMGGVEGVVTKPGYRGKGYLRQLFQHTFKELNNRGEYFSVVFPIFHPVYEHIGYGLADEHIFYQFKLNNIKSKKYPKRIFKGVEEIIDDIKQVYSISSNDFNYIAQRYEYQWNLKNNQVDYKYICYDENKRPVGYCLLKFLNNHYLFKNPSETLHIVEAFWLDKKTKHAIFQDFLYSFRDQRKYGSIVLPVNENLIELLNDPIIETRTIKPSSRIRIVNAKEVLSRIHYSMKDFHIVIKIHDTYCDWNNKTLELISERGEVKIRENSSNNQFDLEITISALGELLVGSKSIDDLVEFENVDVNLDSLELINKIFPKQINFFRDFF
ncbi:MAG: enhanced intracellular survival protein Eis [Candidatus Hodarchaeota archaeon]